MRGLGVIVLLLGMANPCLAGRPNVLFIAVDDLRPELGSYGAAHIKSPNIDRLAAQGIQFNNAHAQQSICMASRASVLTGFRPEYHDLYNGGSVVDLLPDALTINRHFEGNGYQVAAYGKIYHYESDHIAQFGKAWSDGSADLLDNGKYATRDSLDKMALNRRDPVRPHENRGPAFESAAVEDDAYSDGHNTERALETALSEELAVYLISRDGDEFRASSTPAMAPLLRSIE